MTAEGETQPTACFACTSSAESQCTLLLESGRQFEGKYLCETCRQEFRAEPWIEVREGARVEPTATPED